MDILTYAMAKSGAKAYTDAAIAGMAKGFDYKGSKPTAADLPSSGNKKGDCWTTTDTGAEYIWDGTQWIELGRTTSPLWGSITGNIEDQTDLNSALSEKQDKLTAGNNITIENNVISSVSKTYMPLKDSWKVSSTPGGLTLEEFCTAINNDNSVVEGNAFCGNINSSNFFEGMYTASGSQVGSAEVSVQIMGPWQDGHVQLLTVTSSNNPPYLWQYTWVDGLASWVSWSDVRPVSSGYSNELLNYISINGEQYKIANLPSYTAADEGKIVKIVNGVPTWVTE